MGRQIYGSPPVVTVQGTLTTLQSQAGRQPSQPTITSPTSGATLSSFTPTLSSSAFFVTTPTRMQGRSGSLPTTQPL